MSARSSYSHANAATHSLIHWLALGGVAFDVGDQPAQYHASRDMSATADDADHTSPSNAQQGRSHTTHINSVPSVGMASSSSLSTSSRKTAPKTAPSIAINIETFPSYKELEEFYTTWKTLGLAKTASQAVLPTGNLSKPDLLVISDIPDDYEDRHGQAFSSPANQAIRTALRMAGFVDDRLAFTYLSKWRTPAKRPLTNPEKDICMQLLSQEIGFIAPKAILTLGESTIRALVPDSEAKSIKNMLSFNYTNHMVNETLTVFASPKSEFLLKNAAMKKSFWFSLLDLADRNGA